MDRLVEGHALADAQGGAAGHQRGVEGDDRIVLARIDLGERVLSQDGRFSSAWPSETTSTPAAFKPAMSDRSALRSPSTTTSR